MTRINTNVSSLTAQNSLAKSQMSLQQSLTRLSTGLRINSGKDDPAGLIASEVLKSNITSTQAAVTNSQRANQMIATADSALGQVSSLLNDVRGLVSAAANTGAMSADQIAANQLQIDSSLDAIDRISQVTQFQGKRLLDGNLDFVTQGVSNSQITGLQIDQATFGTQNSIAVAAQVVAQAQKATLNFGQSSTTADTVLQVGGSKGFQAFNFAAGSTVADIASAINLVSDATGVQANVTAVTTTTATTGEANVNGTNSGGVSIAANTAGKSQGDVTIVYDTTAGNGATSATQAAGVMTVALQTSSWGNAGNNGAVALGNGGTITLQAVKNGSHYNGVTLDVVDLGGAGATTATYDYAANKITVTANIAGPVLGTAVQTAINTQLGSLFNATAAVAGTGITAGAKGAVTDTAGTDGGVINAAATYTAVAAAITAGTNSTVAGTATGTAGNTATAFTHYATFGSENAGLTTDLNNGIQLLSGDGAASLPVNFVAAGNNQALGVNFTANTDTNGYATAYVQGSNADSTLKITALNQGTQYDNVAVSYVQSAADRGVVFDAETKTLKVYNDFDGNAVTAAAVQTQINDAVGTGTGAIFSASLVSGSAGGGVVTTGLTGTTAGGNKYTGVTINLATDGTGTVTSKASDVIAAINASTEMQSQGISASNLGSSTGTGLVTTGSATFKQAGETVTNGYASASTVNRGGQNAQMVVSAKNAGAAYNDVKVNFLNDSTITAGSGEYVQYDASTKQLNVHIVSGTSTLNDVLNNFTSVTNPTDYALFTLSAAGNGTGVLYSGDTGKLAGGLVTTGTTQFGGVKLTGNHDVGDVVGSGLSITSQDYGSKQFVSVKALSGTFQLTNSLNQISDRQSGTDINVRVNGVQAVADGVNASISTAALSMKFKVASTVAANTTLNFNIISGGAQFQLGPDVVSNQQARMGISSVSTATLGGSDGYLYQLRSGGSKSLTNNVSGAATIVNNVITQVTNLRGRLGAFQKTTLDTNINSLNDTLQTLTAAQSDIADADFAAESASMTRSQILVQSGLSVLSIANSSPRDVLSLLRG